ncbi:glucose-6-phosphate dehydrogenase [Ligilactobacillus equi]|uniref:Glucose-6-phosphate 1-dehydrogenase n=2 Tax=Ligilactobacillus equi TaxID=137357 RepID=V7HTT0_9LACO|nr:glucose-6-phosphate dehydrogenase [Ligilactobacillus equi]ETA73629.1 glucose-6-phosphate dehydrogenase [Ligilactobacillus equi DPC 6820]KRL85330.1 glucose-6-phosphate dehydrogenase [Ligilactobacillus equi DSM 15833 = JCM 10991]MCQ2557297.1 glucose-6-phosphate dehydrogenase [Ligilactobacillus sp.]
MRKEEKALIVIFGGTGDLAQRKLYPSLFNLYKRGFLKDNFAVIGTARRPWSDDYYREIIINAVGDAEDINGQATDFASHFYYQSHNVNDTEHYATLKQLADKLDDKYQIGGNRVFYLAMSPSFFGTIAAHLKSQNLKTTTGYNRVIVEKPFGHDYESAMVLNEEIAQAFPEEEVYRIDHYLGKEMVQNIPAIRFGNNIFNALWNNRYISNIQVTLSESLGVEERGGYYDTAGALRDMIQNHTLQIVSLLTMSAPVSFTDTDIRNAKINALKSLRVYKPEEVAQNFVRGQYGPGSDKPGYRQEDMVDADSMTETFVAGKLEVNTMDMAGVPIYVRTGKRMREKATRVDVVFKQVPNNVFGEGDNTLRHDVLHIMIDPEPKLSLQLNSKTIGHSYEYDTNSLNLNYSVPAEQRANIPEAYEKLILDVLQGKASNFASSKELEYSWKFIDSVRQAWDKNIDDMIFPNYSCGSMGPKAADALLEKDGNHWEF